MKIKEITNKIEEFAPTQSAESWDNVGLMVGSLSRECTGVLVALDLTTDVLAQAIENGCNLIITHHPFLFYPIKSIDTDMTRGEMIETLLKNGITVYSAHTNMDVALGGLCETLAKKIGGENLQASGVGVLCEVAPQPLKTFAEHVANVLGDNSVKYVGDDNKMIGKVFCICGGGASNSAYDCAKGVADCFVTGDFKHNHYVEAQNDEFSIVEFSHYHSEVFVMDIFEKIIADCGVKIIKANQKCPFRIVGGKNEI